MARWQAQPPPRSTCGTRTSPSVSAWAPGPYSSATQPFLGYSKQLSAYAEAKAGPDSSWPQPLCALTASGGLIGLLLATLVLLWPGTTARRGWPLLGAALLNAPWLIAGLARTTAATTDPASVRAFAARDEGYGGVLPTLLTLGGSWNADVVPSSRGDLLPLVLGFAMLLASTVGVVIWWRQDRLAAPLVIAALLAILIGLAGVVAPNAAAQVVAHVPGAGLLRDGQRYLPPLVLLESIGLGAALAALLHVAPLKRLVAVTAVLLPIAALPGLAFGGGLKVSHYPDDWKQARQVLGRRSASRRLHPLAVRGVPGTGLERSPPGAGSDGAVLHPAGRSTGRVDRGWPSAGRGGSAVGCRGRRGQSGSAERYGSDSSAAAARGRLDRGRHRSGWSVAARAGAAAHRGVRRSDRGGLPGQRRPIATACPAVVRRCGAARLGSRSRRLDRRCW